MPGNNQNPMITPELIDQLEAQHALTSVTATALRNAITKPAKTPAPAHVPGVMPQTKFSSMMPTPSADAVAAALAQPSAAANPGLANQNAGLGALNIMKTQVAPMPVLRPGQVADPNAVVPNAVDPIVSLKPAAVTGSPTGLTGNSGAAGGGNTLSAEGKYEKYLSDSEKRKDELLDKQLTVTQSKVDAEKAKNQAMALGHETAAANATKELQESDARLAKARGEADTADKESQDRVQQLMNMHVDPSRFAHSLGTGGQIAMIIGVTLGAFGEALGGGPNVAMHLLQSGIERDISAQRDDIQNAKDSAGMLDKISRQRYGRAMDMHELETKTRLDHYNYALANVDAQVAKLNDPVLQANGEALKLDLTSQRDAVKDDYAKTRYALDTTAEGKRAAAAAHAQARADKQEKRLDDWIKHYEGYKDKDGNPLYTHEEAVALSLSDVGVPIDVSGIEPKHANPRGNSKAQEAVVDANVMQNMAQQVQHARKLNKGTYPTSAFPILNTNDAHEKPGIFTKMAQAAAPADAMNFYNKMFAIAQLRARVIHGRAPSNEQIYGEMKSLGPNPSDDQIDEYIRSTQELFRTRAGSSQGMTSDVDEAKELGAEKNED